MRTWFERPSCTMRLSARTATSTSVARRSSVRERSASSITCLNRPIAASTRARAAQAQARAAQGQVHGLAVPARLRARHRQRLGPAAQGGVVRHRQGQPEQADDGADQALALAQRQAEHRVR